MAEVRARRTLERELEELLEQERFEPPEEFREQALVTDESRRTRRPHATRSPGGREQAARAGLGRPSRREALD